MENSKPDLTERKHKIFVTDQDGKIRLVESFDEHEVFLAENLILEDHQSKVYWLCENCGAFVSSFVKFYGEIHGLECRCALKRAKMILSDEFWNHGSHSQREIEKALMIKHKSRRDMIQTLFRNAKNMLVKK